KTATVFAVGATTPYSVEVHVVDSLGLSFDKTFTITVTPAPPTDIALSSTTVGAAQPTVPAIGALSTGDPNAGQAFTYSLTGADAGPSSPARASSDLKTATVFAVGAATPYSVGVHVVDSLGLSFDKTFTITVDPAPPTDINLSNT